MDSIRVSAFEPTPPKTVVPALNHKLKLAIVGCGASTRINHLPAARASACFETVALVDQFLSRAEELASEHSVPNFFADYRGILGVADAAVLALPNYLHAPVAIELLNHGIHVLVEKPMAINTTECDAMIAAAERSETTLAVGLEFRYFADSQFIKEVLDAGLLGVITSFDMRLGLMFTWPLASDYLLHREQAGGGVLMDFGVHVLDLLLWWLGDYVKVRYADDARGGVEANCTLEIELSGGAVGTIELSRTRKLRNSLIMKGERGQLEIALWVDDPGVRLLVNGGATILSGHIENNDGSLSCEDAIRAEIEDFAQAIQNRRAPRVSGVEARKSIALIQSCYENRRRLRLPWSF